MTMKLNIAYPQYGAQKMLELEDEKQIRVFYDRRIGEELPADILGDEFKGYVLKITGGFDKDGFAMKQGILVNHRVRIVLDGSTGHYRPKRQGCRKRKSVRGCIVGPDLSCINLVIVKKGPAELPGLTNPDAMRPSLRGPKRANNIRKLWGLSKDDDVRQYVSRKKLPATEKHKKERFRSPKIQRLITPQMLQRKRRRIALKRRRYNKSQREASEYAKLLNQLRKEKRQALLSKKRKSTVSTKKSDATTDKSAKSEKSASTKDAGKRKKPSDEKAKSKVAPSKGAVEKKKTDKTTKGAAKAKADPKAAKGGATKPKPAGGDKAKASPKQADKPAAEAKKGGQQGAAKGQTKQAGQQKQGGQQQKGQGNKGGQQKQGGQGKAKQT